MQKLAPRLKNLQVSDDPVTVEVVKHPRKCDRGRSRWYRVQFVAIKDPATGDTVRYTAACSSVSLILALLICDVLLEGT